ncbi:hypothetical protein OG689_42930 [Kitasatospora sp. NBC_00240]|uniref:hypothetical protein n=1 Tax=Kitasatospora sp. NBC_00240 TaxID=2903567 RepID=UPI00224D5F4D|nr:hypothetical protein [Kitasatospora sp. NBC_00240]MCX5215899.1 hypothetical protein [Kitasatospora sp. NBC_00240]
MTFFFCGALNITTQPLQAGRLPAVTSRRISGNLTLIAFEELEHAVEIHMKRSHQCH